MNSDITRFINREPSRKIIFDNMCKLISNKLDISSDIVQDCGEMTMKSWEGLNNDRISNILIMDFHEKKEEIDELLDIFRGYIGFYLKEDEKVKKSMEIATLTFNSFFLYI